MVYQCTCKSRQKSTSWVTFRNIAFVIMSIRIVLLLYRWTKQTVHLHYYWFWVTTVFLDDLLALFQRVCMVFFCPEKCPEILQFYCSKKFTVPRPVSWVTHWHLYCVLFIRFWRVLPCYSQRKKEWCPFPVRMPEIWIPVGVCVRRASCL